MTPSYNPGCTGKVQFTTPRDAMKGHEKDRRGGGVKVHPYQCPFCSKWHLTSRTRDFVVRYQRGRK